MVRNRDGKMVVLLATALALGVGAVAACVVPWFYCKPPDGDDDTREATGIRDRTDPGSHYRSTIPDNSTPAPNVRITGISYVRFVVPPTPSTSFVSAASTSVMRDSTILNAVVNENPSIVGDGHPIQTQSVKPDVEAIQPPGNTDPMSSGLTNSAGIETDRQNQINTGHLPDSKVSVPESAATQSSGSEFENSGIPHSGFINPSTLRVKVAIRSNDSSTSITLPITETSNPTEESSIDPTSRTLSSTSASESKTTTSLTTSSSSTYPESSELTSSTKTEERSATIPTTSSDISNPTDESSTETSNVTSQESMNSSSGPTRVATKAIIEYSKMSNPLETIREVSTSPAPSFEPSPMFPKRLENVAPGIQRTPNTVWFGHESSITSTSTRASYGKAARRPGSSKGTPFVPGNPDTPDSTDTTSRSHQHPETRRKTSRTSRYPLFGRIMNILRAAKPDWTPRTGRSKPCDQESHMDSVKSFSAGEKIPAGHSTLMSEEDRLLESIRTRRSPKVLPMTCPPMKVFEDPAVFNSNNPSWAPLFEEDVEEEPLDLSIRSSPDRSDDKMADTTIARRRSSTESCRQVFREVADYLKVRKTSRSSDEVVSRSESLKCRDDVSDVSTKDENQNVTSVASKVEPVKVEVAAGGSRRDSEAASKNSKLDRSCLPKSNGLPRRIKKFLHIGGKDRGRGNEILTSVPKPRISSDVPAEFQRNSAATSSRLKSEVNAKVRSSPDSSTDVTSFYELGIAKSDHEGRRDVPCTEL